MVSTRPVESGAKENKVGSQDAPAVLISEQIRRTLEKEAEEISIFHLLDKGEVETIASYFDLVSYPAGSVLIREGEHLDYLGIVVSGKLEASHRPTIGEKAITIAHLEDGAHIGTIAFSRGRPAMASITAEEATDLLVLPAGKFESLAAAHPRTAVKILTGIIDVLTVRLESAIDKIVLFY